MTLWKEEGVKVLPGAYLSRDPSDGSPNPGAGFIRAALVAPADDVAHGLRAIRDVLGRM